MTMSRTQARDAVAIAHQHIVPDADLATLDDDGELRDELEIDSLDFLSLVELLSNRTGVHIDEDDYPRLRSMSTCIHFLTEQTGHTTLQ